MRTRLVSILGVVVCVLGAITIHEATKLVPLSTWTGIVVSLLATDLIFLLPVSIVSMVIGHEVKVAFVSQRSRISWDRP